MTTSMLPNRMAPVLGWRNVASTCIRLDLPAPLGPKRSEDAFPHLEADAPDGLSSIRVSQSEVLDDQHAR